MGERSYLSIGQVLDLLKLEFPDLTISKIRFLESQGLLDPERTPSGYRKFYDPDVERLRFILREQSEHYLPLKVIRGRLGEDGADDGLLAEVLAAPPGEPPVASDRPEGASAAPTRAASGAATRAASGAASGAATAATPAGAAGGPRLELVDTDLAADGSISSTLEELAEATGLATADIAELERFGLITGRKVAGTVYYDSDCAEIAALAAGFRSFGVEARHLRMYHTAVEREAGFFEQVVTPMLKQRNPQARRQAVETLRELSRLGNGLRAAVLRQALRDYIGGP